MPSVSFCISTFKRPEFLLTQLEHISKQTFIDFEVIVSDNDQECSAKRVVDQFDSRFRYFSNDGNIGMISSFNKSIERSTGDYILMITDDDPVYPNSLETLIELKDKYPGYGMYLGGCDWFCTDLELGKRYKLSIGTNTCLSNNYNLNHIMAFSSEEFVERVYSFKIFSHYLWSTCIVKREIIVEMGGVPDYGTPFLGDYAYIGIMGSHSGCVIINKSLGCQTLHKENFGRNQNDQLIIVANNFPKYLESKMSGLKNWSRLKGQIHNFVALNMVSHLSFLKSYPGIDRPSLLKAEKDIFALDYIKKYKLKYYLKTHYPKTHDSIVIIKKWLIK